VESLTNLRLADLLYGHPGEYVQQFGRKYDPSLAAGESICLGELTCGCWIVLDGNSRTGLLLSASPNATIADYPEAVLLAYPKGSWDPEVIEWWNPAPKTFAEVMSSKRYIQRRPAECRAAGMKTFYGLIERISAGDYYGVITSAFMEGGPIAARSSSPARLEEKLREAIWQNLDKLGTFSNEGFDIKLTGHDEAVHVCRQTTPREAQT